LSFDQQIEHFCTISQNKTQCRIEFLHHFWTIAQNKKQCCIEFLPHFCTISQNKKQCHIKFLHHLISTLNIACTMSPNPHSCVFLMLMGSSMVKYTTWKQKLFFWKVSINGAIIYWTYESYLFQWLIRFSFLISLHNIEKTQVLICI